MNNEQEQVLRDILEKTEADLQALSLTVDTVSLGLEHEKIELQATASLKAIGMGLNHIRQNISNALKIEQDTR